VLPRSAVSPAPLAVVGWLVIGGLLAVAAVRASGWDTSALAVGVLAASPWLYLAAWPVGVVAVASGRWALAAGAAVIVAAQLWWVAPQWAPFPHTVSLGVGHVGLRVFDANVTWTNADMAGVASQIARARPDLVVLEEITDDDVAALDATGVLGRFAWHLVAPSQFSEGMGLWSAVPIEGAAVWDDAGHPALRAVLSPGGAEAVNLLLVHPYIPFGRPVSQWRQELAAIAVAARATPRPLVVVGDFNATWDMPGLRAVADTGLRDAAVLAGVGWQMTWAPRPGIPAVARLDHLLLSRPLGVVSYREAPIAGGQHHALTVELAVPRT
jgi:endonuclease/exonuclease/phosphatase (EEP) superfamily protein YafD